MGAPARGCSSGRACERLAGRRRTHAIGLGRGHPGSGGRGGPRCAGPVSHADRQRLARFVAGATTQPVATAPVARSARRCRPPAGHGRRRCARCHGPRRHGEPPRLGAAAAAVRNGASGAGSRLRPGPRRSSVLRRPTTAFGPAEHRPRRQSWPPPVAAPSHVRAGAAATPRCHLLVPTPLPPLPPRPQPYAACPARESQPGCRRRQPGSRRPQGRGRKPWALLPDATW